MKHSILVTLSIFLFGCSAATPVPDCVNKQAIISPDTGQKNGQEWLCHQDGQWQSRGEWKEGKKSGTWTWWFDNGQKTEEGSFRNGIAEGQWTSWYRNGQKDAEGNRKNGYKDGKWLAWFKNGQKKSEAIWKNSRPVDIETHWNEDGDVIKTTTHKKDEEIE